MWLRRDNPVTLTVGELKTLVKMAIRDSKSKNSYQLWTRNIK